MGSEALLPVIVFSDKLKSGTLEWESVRARVQQALQEYGSFEACFNKVPFELRKSMFGAIQEIFELPLQTKSGIPAKTPFGGYIGKSPTAPWREIMAIEDVLIPEKLTSFTNLLWPQGNPSLGKTVGAFSEKVAELDQMTRRMVLESFGVEEYYDEHIDSSRYSLRVMKYEAPETMESKLMLKPHTDKNLLTILYQINQVGGLQVQSKDGKWINVKTSPDSFIVMAGDSFHAWTNGRVRAPVHQVTMTENETRYSAGLFASPKEGRILKVPDFPDELKPGTPEWDSMRPRVQQALQEYGGFEALFNKVPSNKHSNKVIDWHQPLQGDLPFGSPTRSNGEKEDKKHDKEDDFL
ncbi:probable 2-oxoglutarate-dependent dioxygenase AOP1 [Cornus florida]|uniref:probable 2-oxoglutarate-dependent dioxygenase AOP1 n=1 Tax=Cornus florida TaxID=4283 RepID=UPI00289C6B16|nr:probable 2-oxoglutarate-dependent dioxygenase AOP1 [Cornus florida]